MRRRVFLLFLIVSISTCRSLSHTLRTPISMAHHAHDKLPEFNSPHNFGPASLRDDLVFGSFRPAFSEETEGKGLVEDADVAQWAKFMREQSVKRVVCLLNDEELDFYKTPLNVQMAAAGFEGDRSPHFSTLFLFGTNFWYGQLRLT